MSSDYIPRPEGILVSFLDNIVVKLPAYAALFKMNTVDMDFPFPGEAAANSLNTILYGRFPDYVIVRVQNTGTVSLNVGTTVNADDALSAPITAVAAGTSVDLTILAMGGGGRPFVKIENTAPATDCSYIVYTTRLGRNIHIADSTIREINLTNQVRNDYQQQVDKKDVVKKDNVSMLRDEIQDLKDDNKYETSIGEDLDIISEAPTIDVGNAKPELNKKKVPTGWSIGYNLKGYFDGIYINRKRPADADFTFWKQRTTGKAVIDTEPMVNGTQYEAYFMIGDELVGQPSDILTISL